MASAIDTPLGPTMMVLPFVRVAVVGDAALNVVPSTMIPFGPSEYDSP